jgi:hypothetical protein
MELRRKLPWFFFPALLLVRAPVLAEDVDPIYCAPPDSTVQLPDSLPLVIHPFGADTTAYPNVGTVSLASAGLGPATAVRVTFFHQNRSGERISTRN